MIYIIFGIILDFLLGDPYSFPHPVKLMGRIISFEDRNIRKRVKSSKLLKALGLMIFLINTSFFYFISKYILELLSFNKILYDIINTYIIYSCIAANNLSYEARKVLDELEHSIIRGRNRLRFIVGRETDKLSEEEILRATIETVSENTSDGVIAPLFFIFLLGAPGGLLYKMVNTMDSMIGYKNDKYRDLGFFPAKADDLFNLIPARLTGLLMCISSVFKYDVKQGFYIMFRDRKNHSSPNAIYPEGAVAGLLNIQLGGPSYYFGQLIEKPTIGDKNRPITREDPIWAVDIMYRTEILFIIFLLFIDILGVI